MDYSLAPLGSGPPVQPHPDLSNLIASTSFYQLIFLKVASIIKPFFCGAFKSTAITVRPYVAPLLNSSPSLASAVGGIVSSCTTLCNLDITNSTLASLPSEPAPRHMPYSAEEIYGMGFMSSGSAGLFWQTPASYSDPAWLETEDTSIPPVTEYISYVLLPTPDFVDPYCQQLSSACRLLSNASGNAAEGVLVAPVNTAADTEASGFAQALIRAVSTAGSKCLSDASSLVSGWVTWVWSCLSEIWAVIARWSIRAVELFIRFCRCEWLVDTLLPVYHLLCRAGLWLYSGYSAAIQASIRGFEMFNRLCSLEWLVPDYILARRPPTWDESWLAKPDGTTWRWVRDGLWSGMVWLGLGFAKWVSTVIGTFWFLKTSWLYILKHFDRENASDDSTDTASSSPRLHAFILDLEALSARPVLYWFCFSPLHFSVWLLLCAGGWQTGASSLVPASDDALTDSADGTDANLTAKDTDVDDSKATGLEAPRTSASGTRKYNGSVFSEYRESQSVVWFEQKVSALSKSSLFEADDDDEDYIPMPEVRDAGVDAVAAIVGTWKAYRASPVVAPVNGFYLGLTSIMVGGTPVPVNTSPFTNTAPVIASVAAATANTASNATSNATSTATTANTANATSAANTTDNARVANLNAANDTADTTGTAHANADGEEHAYGEKVQPTAANPQASSTPLDTATSEGYAEYILSQTPDSGVVTTDAHDKNAITNRVGATTEEKDDEAKAGSREEEKRASRYSFVREDLVDSATSPWAPSMPRDEGVVVGTGVAGAAKAGVIGANVGANMSEATAPKPLRLAIMAPPARNATVNTAVQSVQATADGAAKVSGTVNANAQATPTGVKPAQTADVKPVKTVGGSGYSYTADTLSGATMSLAADIPRVERVVRPAVIPATNQPTSEQVKEMDDKIEEHLRGYDKDHPQIRRHFEMINAGVATSQAQAKKPTAAVAPMPVETEKPKPKKAKKNKKKKKKKASGGAAPTGAQGTALNVEKDAEEVEEDAVEEELGQYICTEKTK